MWCFKLTFIVIAIISLVTDTEAQLGQSCRTPNGEYAVCKSVYNCDILLNVIQKTHRKSSELRFVRQSQCGYYMDGPLVCCGSDSDYVSIDVTTKTPTRPSTGNRNNLIPDRTRCGFQESDKIFGGKNTSLDEFPWMALLEYENSFGQRKFACGGTLISPKYILTAAHCVTGEINTKIGRLVTVRLGEWNTDTYIDCLSPTNCNQPPMDVPVESAIAHEGYDQNNMDRYNDIALVRLRSSVPYTNYIRPICLPKPDESSRPNQVLIVAGWGRTENAVRSPVKLKLQVPLASMSSCKSTFRSAGIRLWDAQLCAGGQGGKDSCSGDSGGPLMQTSKDDVSQWYIEGIVSFGNVCGTEGWPGVYTRVSNYLDWIYSKVRP